MGRYLAALLVAAGGLAQGMSLTGRWNLTFELLPTTRIYESELTLKWGFMPGWRVESESKIYSDGLLRYQNFYLSGSLGEFDLWGKIYFHAQERRYQRVWFNAEIPFGGGTFRSSFNHWATAADYTSSDKDKFGPWPCLEVVSWEDAWKFMTREVYVTGPVVGYYYPGYLILNIGRAFPDPDRFQIYIPAANVPAFEHEFGVRFWETWLGKTVCVRGTIKGRRYTKEGPGDGGYSVAEVSISSPSVLSVGPCAGLMIAPTCPGTVVKWFYARHNHVGQTVYVQGPVASVTGPATYYGCASHYRVRIGGGAVVGNRVEVILPYPPGWSTAGTSYTTEVCVQGRVTLSGGVAVILPSDLISVSGRPCCGGGLPGTFLNWRFRYTLAPWTFTVDFGDCCVGFSFRQLSVAVKSLPLCCGLTYDASLSFTKAGFESLAFTLKNLPWFCCGLTADLSVKFTPDAKTLTFKPSWPGIGGCLTVYGDVVYRDATLPGLVLYGFDIVCYFGPIKLRSLTAFDPDKVEDLTDVTFYPGEWEYLGLFYTGTGCCGGSLRFASEFWFGSAGTLFDLQRVRATLEVPITANIVLFTKMQFDLSDPSPLDYLNVGWKMSF